MFIKQKNFSKILLIGILVLIPFILSIRNVLSGNMSFWYDPARDFLLAWDNLKKPALIGQPTGIPGLFYGPYWIWFISLAILISPDPRIITLIVLTIPYTIFFPYLLSKFKSIFSDSSWVFLWLLFYYNYRHYFISPWNPHLAPLFFLAFIYYFSKSILSQNKWLFLVSGIFAGLIINFSFSFGIGVFAGSLLFLLIRLTGLLLTKRKKLLPKIIPILSVFYFYLLGFVGIFTPFILFEFRHGFGQLKSLREIIVSGFLYQIASVGVTGLTKLQIISQMILTLSTLLHLPQEWPFPFVFFSLFCLIIIYFLVKCKSKLTQAEKNISSLLICIGISVLVIFLGSKNPIWVYHFTGYEIIFLLLIAIVIQKLKFLKSLLTCWVILLTIVEIYKFILPQKENPYRLSTLITKQMIIDKIYQDSNNQPFTVFVHSPAIYTFDYDYLFLWYGKNKYSLMPFNNLQPDIPVYLIIPKTILPIKEDFIHYKTPDQEFQTVEEWQIEDGTSIIKRREIEKS